MGGDIGRRMPEIPWTDEDMEKAAEATRRERERADIAEQEKRELLDFIRRVLGAGTWYASAIEIDMHKPDAFDGEMLEAEARAILAKHIFDANADVHEQEKP